MLDETDRRLLRLLQKDASLTVQELGAALNLSPSQAGRRRQRLEREGVVRGYAARLDPVRLGLGIQAFVQVELASHGPAEARAFARLVETVPEILSAWTMTGQTDYLLRIACADLSSLNRLIHEILLANGLVSRVRSQIVMDQIKADSGLPV